MLIVKGILSCLIIITCMITVVWGVVISFKVELLEQSAIREVGKSPSHPRHPKLINFSFSGWDFK